MGALGGMAEGGNLMKERLAPVAGTSETTQLEEYAKTQAGLQLGEDGIKKLRHGYMAGDSAAVQSRSVFEDWLVKNKKSNEEIAQYRKMSLLSPGRDATILGGPQAVNSLLGMNR